MNITTDYTDRTIDVLAWDTEATNGAMAGGKSTGKVVAGIQKLGQRFCIALLNETGSVKYDYKGFGVPFGSYLLTAIRQGSVHTEAELFSTFALAELDVKRQLQAEETEDDPDDERYNKATLSSVVLDADSATLTIQLYSKASDVQLVLPIPTIP